MTPDQLAGERWVHFVGIGGAGLSAMALILHERGATVTGSDAFESPTVARLRSRGIRVTIGHAAGNVGGAALVVRSRDHRIGDDNPELVEARRRRVPVWDRTEAMVDLMTGTRGVAVAGTHGKTTTTALLALILRAGGRDPSYIVGAEVPDLGDNGHAGTDELMVVEADESDGTFLALPCEAGLVTSVEPDHMEHFGTVERLHADFARFVTALPGARVVCADDPFLRGLPGTVRYGSNGASTYRLRTVEPMNGGARLTIETPLGAIDTPFRFPARHFALNATGAAALAMELGARPDAVAEGLSDFRGVARRLEERGSAAGVRIVDDYAHLPTEVASTVQASAGSGRLVAVFQPHLYTRTQALWREFGPAFKGADVVVITDVFAAREIGRPLPGVTGELVVNAVREALPDVEVIYVADRPDVAPVLARVVRPGDLVLTMGAGDIATVPDELLALLEAR